MDIDVIPDREVPGELLVESGIGLLDAAESLVREDDAKPERIVGSVSLPDRDLMVRVQELEKSREIQPGRTASDDPDVERRG